MTEEKMTIEERKEVLRNHRRFVRKHGMSAERSLDLLMGNNLTAKSSVVLLLHELTCPDIMASDFYKKWLRSWCTVLSFDESQETVLTACLGKIVVIPLLESVLGKPELDNKEDYTQFLQAIGEASRTMVLQTYKHPGDIQSVVIALSGLGID